MSRTTAIARVLVASLLWLLPASAVAQSAIAGVVKDSSGAVLPGVTVEVASPQLIERVRSVSTDERGAYQLVDLRPGIYSVTFTLAGFNTSKREGLELPSDFTATVNGELKVGALEETVTVSGASPVVDVQSTAKAQVIDRDMLDSIPTAHTAQTAAALVAGVIMGTPDVGGSGAMNQNATTAHGFNSAQTTVLLDGIQLNGMCGNGATQSYSNTQNYEEITVANAGAGADVSAGGVRQNLVPRRGGNEFHGSGATIYSSGDWQAAAVTPELAARGLKQGDSFASLYTLETGFGGKFIKDRLWWFGAARKQASNVKVADTFYPDGRQGVNEQYIKNASLRLTWQVNQRNQLNVFHDRVFRYLGHDMSAGYEPQAAMLTLPSPLYEQSQVKWTSTISSKLYLEAGFNQYQAYRTNVYQEGVQEPYGTAAWYAKATRRDTSLGTVRTAYPMTNSIQNPTRRFLVASASYVTGSHNVKVGIQNNWGYEWFALYKNADLEQNYQNGVPTAVVVFNTPVVWNNALDANTGIYAQDSWSVKRLTVNYGLRWEYFQGVHSRRGQHAWALRSDDGPSFRPADLPGLEGIHAALRPRPRRLRQCEDRVEVQREQVTTRR
ncbi:MAG: TonB-dependent receptor [Vicinamibacterales bacterium]